MLFGDDRCDDLDDLLQRVGVGEEGWTGVLEILCERPRYLGNGGAIREHKSAIGGEMSARHANDE